MVGFRQERWYMPAVGEGAVISGRSSQRSEEARELQALVENNKPKKLDKSQNSGKSCKIYVTLSSISVAPLVTIPSHGPSYSILSPGPRWRG